MNHLQEWALRFIAGREGSGQTTRGLDVVQHSHNVPVQELIELVNAGFLSLEQANRIPSLQNSVGSSTILKLTEQGKSYLKIKSI